MAFWAVFAFLRLMLYVAAVVVLWVGLFPAALILSGLWRLFGQRLERMQFGSRRAPPAVRTGGQPILLLLASSLSLWCLPERQSARAARDGAQASVASPRPAITIPVADVGLPLAARAPRSAAAPYQLSDQLVVGGIVNRAHRTRRPRGLLLLAALSALLRL